MTKFIITTNNFKILIDDEDFESLSQYKWRTIDNKKYVYAARGTRKKGIYSCILMHRYLMNAPRNKMVDHINGNTLDNRKSNLRLVSRYQNLQNSKIRNDSKCNYKGVRKMISKTGLVRFNARIQIAPNKRLYLGHFKTEKEAAQAYNKAAIEYFGEFAKLNVIK